MSTIIEQKACMNVLDDRLSCNETRDESPSVNIAFDGYIQITRTYPVGFAPWRYAQIFKNMTIRL